MEEKKRYPINMWTKLTRVVNNTDAIPRCHKESFINIVGDKVASYRNQKIHKRYKPQELPVYVKRKYKLVNDNYHTILNWDEDKLSAILIDIYNCMKAKWFNDYTGGKFYED